MLAKTIDLVQEARRHGIAVGAFNTYDIELTHAIVLAAEKLQRPIILQLGVQPLKAYGEPLVQATIAAARVARVPVALHLDHCADIGLIEQCLHWGFSSALADGSRLSLADNIALTRQAVAIAAQYGATIEGELGYLAGTEDGVTIADIEASLTDPIQAQQFVEQTGASLLAIAIGNVHGYTPVPPALDLARLLQIAERVDVPLVLHGASGLPRRDVQRAIAQGVAKININTEVRSAFLNALADWGVRYGPGPDLRQPGQDFLDLMQTAIAAAVATVEQSIRTCSLL
jgi:tagatose 1,6-diphosphate aldolase GatY/KbaY